MSLEDYIIKVPKFDDLSQTDQFDYLALFHVTYSGHDSFTAATINDILITLDLKPFARASSYLSENSRGKNPKFVKAVRGYRLERQFRQKLAATIGVSTARVSVSNDLISLIGKVRDPNELLFLGEVQKCFEIGAHRATIVLIWLAAVDHLQKYIFINHLVAFNSAIARHPDKRLKAVRGLDDFGDIQESRFIELARSSGSISADVRKILDEKLGIRNTAAHPSNVAVSGHKATEFAMEILTNVLLKY
jgi:hypothetical protein